MWHHARRRKPLLRKGLTAPGTVPGGCRQAPAARPLRLFNPRFSRKNFWLQFVTVFFSRFFKNCDRISRTFSCVYNLYLRFLVRLLQLLDRYGYLLVTVFLSVRQSYSQRDLHGSLRSGLQCTGIADHRHTCKLREVFLVVRQSYQRGTRMARGIAIRKRIAAAHMRTASLSHIMIFPGHSPCKISLSPRVAHMANPTLAGWDLGLHIDGQSQSSPADFPCCCSFFA